MNKLAKTAAGEAVEDLVKLSFFSEIGKAISASYTVSETLNAVMEQIGRIFAPTHWSLLLRNHTTGELTFTVVVGSGVSDLKGKKLPRGKGVAGWIAEKGTAVIVEDVGRDERFDPDMDSLVNFHTKSIIGVPLKSRDRVFGVIELVNKLDGSPFSSLELNLLQTVADYAAIAIEKAYYLRSLKKIASLDSLTGLYNRRTFVRYLDKEIEQAKRTGETFSLLMLDVDAFKSINDRFGHSAGDEVLKRLAAILEQTTRKADIVCRYGGDEFMILLPDSGLADAEILMKRIKDRMEEHNKASELKLSVSFGLHEAEKGNVEQIIDIVDKKMYWEKSEKQELEIYDIEKNIQDLMLGSKDD
jgi:diguanylate cyclase (GGDEF)-like protein